MHCTQLSCTRTQVKALLEHYLENCPNTFKTFEFYFNNQIRTRPKMIYYSSKDHIKFEFSRSFSPPLVQGRIYQMVQCQGPGTWTASSYFLVFTLIWQENAANIWPKLFYRLHLYFVEKCSQNSKSDMSSVRC